MNYFSSLFFPLLENMVRGLEDDESKFLGEVAVRQMELEMRKRKEEKDILMEAEEFRISFWCF